MCNECLKDADAALASITNNIQVAFSQATRKASNSPKEEENTNLGYLLRDVFTGVNRAVLTGDEDSLEAYRRGFGFSEEQFEYVLKPLRIKADEARKAEVARRKAEEFQQIKFRFIDDFHEKSIAILIDDLSRKAILELALNDFDIKTFEVDDGIQNSDYIEAHTAERYIPGVEELYEYFGEYVETFRGKLKLINIFKKFLRENGFLAQKVIDFAENSTYLEGNTYDPERVIMIFLDLAANTAKMEDEEYATATTLR